MEARSSNFRSTESISLVKSLPASLNDIRLIIVLASANNECKLYNYDIDGNLKTKSQLEVIKFWTVAYPLDIIGLSHQSYIESLSIGRNKNLSQCVTSMILQTAPPEMELWNGSTIDA
ncbi:9826_t:CDS:2 [Funneliformis mosseae]|uniref:9826_t:CDS:1 n=1 Tax=Funneliformis mosseae TaxID=27381 RepID=A0A9N9E6J3_FUNMO|nr:9826_t:CDS:2 [Funneliformis mosseae]